jgi:ABC-type uncharacterized transport system auxiliary subunit
MASRRLHLAPSEALVSRGSQRAAVSPARGARAQLRVGRWADASGDGASKYSIR